MTEGHLKPFKRESDLPDVESIQMNERGARGIISTNPAEVAPPSEAESNGLTLKIKANIRSNIKIDLSKQLLKAR